MPRRASSSTSGSVRLGRETCLGWHIDPRRCAVGAEPELPVLPADGSLENGLVARAEGRLEDPEFVGVELSLDDGLAQTVGAVDHHHVPGAALRVEREHDAGGAEVGSDHVLDADREADVQVIESMLDSVDDRAIGEERGETASAGRDEGVGASHAEVRLLLSGEARLGEILGRRARADGHARIRPAFLPEDAVGVADLPLESGWPRCLQDELAKGSPGLGQDGHVLARHVLQEGRHPAPESGLVEERGVRLAGDREAVRYLDARGGQFAVELAERGVLAPDAWQIVEADIPKPRDVPRHRIVLDAAPGWLTRDAPARIPVGPGGVQRTRGRLLPSAVSSPRRTVRSGRPGRPRSRGGTAR